MPKKTVLQHPKTCAGGGGEMDTPHRCRGERLGQVLFPQGHPELGLPFAWRPHLSLSSEISDFSTLV